MESYGLEMDDLFDDRNISQELNDFETVDDNAEDSDNGQRENDADNTQNGEEGDISQQVAERLKQLGKGAAKKRVLRPQPKLDPARLTGERGIPILPKLFADVKYKGKGHEASDLNKMMGVLEHWAHRLFPRMPFDELIERVERLGQKSAVRTCVSKIRLDMPILDADFVPQVSDDEDAAGDAEVGGASNNLMSDDEFDRLQVQSQTLDEDEEALNDILEQERLEGDSQRERNSQRLVLTASTPYPKSRPTEEGSMSGLTAEQMEKIRENQEKARKRRLNRSTDASTNDRSMDISAVEPSEESLVGGLQTQQRESTEVTTPGTPRVGESSERADSDDEGSGTIDEPVVNKSTVDSSVPNEDSLTGDGSAPDKEDSAGHEALANREDRSTSSEATPDRVGGSADPESITMMDEPSDSENISAGVTEEASPTNDSVTEPDEESMDVS